jgi:hypothetical protein
VKQGYLGDGDDDDNTFENAWLEIDHYTNALLFPERPFIGRRWIKGAVRFRVASKWLESPVTVVMAEMVTMMMMTMMTKSRLLPSNPDKLQ